ncbi:FAD-dependent oxidoreductase [Steroidobacter sp. S1-65]|uniref:FAD-dependent oxidoreductase n=1 Tax=Steroidobacter gossypii TaxID=2805490 RepID=A0ABS1X147_9GAMM|nr:FAD-dependent oxidoreductase [Steroidobacter gossypii]MBM0106974.1 FAD-dependent oxidoreductase [Steroidobacter gossypii]
MMSFSTARFMASVAALGFVAGCAGSHQNGGAASMTDLVVYGCTPAGLTAAIAAKDRGRSVVLLCRDGHVGGMTTNGLGWADTGNHAAIGGMARRFYQDVKAHYDRVGFKGIATSQSKTEGEEDAMWVFEPHVAEAIYMRWLEEAGITPVFNARLRLDPTAVTKQSNRIVSIEMLDGSRHTGRMFVDASYEGDLMGMAGVTFTTGREANALYGEDYNGVQTANAEHHNFELDIDPYVKPGDPASGLVPLIGPGPPAPDGSGDKRIQAYNFRLCMTTDPAIRAPLPKPADYNPWTYELLGRYLDAGWRHKFRKYDPIPNNKTDVNNYGAISTDFIGGNYDYPTAGYERRSEIFEAHKSYQAGLLWFLQNDPRVPADVRDSMKEWGLCADEFVDTDHWPREMYVREARRMVSDFVMTERHLEGELPTPRSVGLGSYTMDSHNVQRYVNADGFARNEGDVQIYLDRTYEISYDAIVPKAAEATNLFVPVAVSASHIAYGSIRMEPVFMILGQSAGEAAVLAIEHGTSVQNVPYEALARRLRAKGQLIDPVKGKYVPGG